MFRLIIRYKSSHKHHAASMMLFSSVKSRNIIELLVLLSIASPPDKVPMCSTLKRPKTLGKSFFRRWWCG